VEQRVSQGRGQAPAALIDGRHEYLCAGIRASHRDFPAWSSPARFYFRRAGTGWSLVGVERGEQDAKNAS
jgi:hypothetical protein